MTTDEILQSNLIDDQYAAVVDNSKNILCLACAGLGKLRTLAYNIAYLIKQGGMSESIIAFAFTEKAADSIKRRVAEALSKFGISEKLDEIEQFDWREMSIQVQFYSKAVKEVIGDNVEVGYVHTLKNNKRVSIPVDDNLINNAISTIEWAVKGIIHNDFPMRACKSNWSRCDYSVLCSKEREEFKYGNKPPVINTPTGEKDIAAFEEKVGDE